jgi:hypothetical protein
MCPVFWGAGHTDEHISVELVENLVTRTDFNNHLESNRREFDKIWPAGPTKTPPSATRSPPPCNIRRRC